VGEAVTGSLSLSVKAPSGIGWLHHPLGLLGNRSLAQPGGAEATPGPSI